MSTADTRTRSEAAAAAFFRPPPPWTASRAHDLAAKLQAFANNLAVHNPVEREQRLQAIQEVHCMPSSMDLWHFAWALQDCQHDLLLFLLVEEHVMGCCDSEDAWAGRRDALAAIMARPGDDEEEEETGVVAAASGGRWEPCSASTFWRELDDAEAEAEAEALRGRHSEAQLSLAYVASSVMTAVSARVCVGLGRGIMPAAELFQLGAPVLAWHRRRMSKLSSPSVLQLLPLVEALRLHSAVGATRVQDDSDVRFSEAWDRWLGQHPAVARYLDPHLVAVSGPPAAAISGILDMVPVPRVDFPGLGGAPFPCLYQFNSAGDAKAAACALRSHFAHNAAVVAVAAPGGNPAGPIAHIVQFNTSGTIFLH